MQEIKMVSKLYKFCLWKAYFEKGYGLSHYFFKLVAVLGITAGNVKALGIFGVLYAIFCFFLGWGWYHYGVIYQEIEVGNRFNIFVTEMRNSIK